MLCTWEDTAGIYTTGILPWELSGSIFYRLPPRYIGSYDNMHFKTLPKTLERLYHFAVVPGAHFTRDDIDCNTCPLWECQA